MFGKVPFITCIPIHNDLSDLKVIQSDLFYSIGASHVAKTITPSDPTRETDHLDHDAGSFYFTGTRFC